VKVVIKEGHQEDIKEMEEAGQGSEGSQVEGTAWESCLRFDFSLPLAREPSIHTLAY
jgi:hypothetical protein